MADTSDIIGRDLPKNEMEEWEVFSKWIEITIIETNSWDKYYYLGLNHIHPYVTTLPDYNKSLHEWFDLKPTIHPDTTSAQFRNVYRNALKFQIPEDFE